jgi:fatty-acyl-CoA synthase
MWSPNYATWVLVQYATAEIGAILVNLNPACRTHELAYALQHSGCRMVIAAPEFKTSNDREMLAEVTEQCPDLERSIFLWDPAWFELTSGDATVDLDVRRAMLDPDDPINIQYTSGTTGYPKGATLSHRNILNNGRFTSVLQTMTEHDRVCIPVPFYHCFGMVIANLGCTTHGAAIVIPSDAFDPLALLEPVEAERCTALYGVPTMFTAELAHERSRSSTCRACAPA